MPTAGNSYTITLEQAHLGWGTHRHTRTRDPISGEGYIPIPKQFAQEYEIYNSNLPGAHTLYNCISADGLFEGILLAQGCSEAGNIYAKQFAGYSDLKALGRWFSAVGAAPGNQVEVRWTSPVDIIIRLI